MKVYDIEITTEIQEKVLQLLQARPVALCEVSGVVYRLVEPLVKAHKQVTPFYRATAGDVASRAADRILQRERKAGRLAYAGGKWRWLGLAG